MDLVVQAPVVVEGIHSAQPLTYPRLSSLRVGLLMNFNVPVLRTGLGASSVDPGLGGERRFR